ncbi:MAG: hypothetical protein MJ072_06565, partial [Clostridia bacterium]|nr:hypothetical protein [Clostridia bacterium]
MEEKKEKGFSVSIKSFLSAIIIIFALMIVSYVLTFVMPSGSYQRIDGAIVKDSFAYSEKVGLPFYKWILSPFLVLGSDGGITVILVVCFLLVIGGVFNCLYSCGVIEYLIKKITVRFKDKKYLLMAVIIFFFMIMGSMLGTFEEVVPLVPIVVALSIGLG